MNSLRIAIVATIVSFAAITESRADIIVPNADIVSDGALNCAALAALPGSTCNLSCNTACTAKIDLSLAANGVWSQPSAGKGVYDATQWAVVFKYSSVNIPTNVTVTFNNHPSNAPVVWLVRDNVTINGIVNLNGGAGAGQAIPGMFTPPGPGGFRGAAYGPSCASPGSAALGPGGSHYACANAGCQPEGSYAILGAGCPTNVGTTYGNVRIIPLIGGSGGSGCFTCLGGFRGSGGAGGGAILIASQKTIMLGGTISANGSVGNGIGGSGGAIRLVANAVMDGSSAGKLFVNGGNAGSGNFGRIRIEANSLNIAPTYPQFSGASPGATAILWPNDLGNPPIVRIISVGGNFVPDDPRASYYADVRVDTAAAIVVDAQNVPEDWFIEIRMVPRQGNDLLLPAIFISGDAVHSTWLAMMPANAGLSILQARAYAPSTAAAAGETEENAGNPVSNVEPE